MKIIAAGDFHFPFENKKALAVFEKHLGQKKWDYFILGGDLIDFPYLSKYSKNNLRSIEGKRITKDYDYANEHLDRWDSILKGTKTQKVFIIGNHDQRVEKYIDANPNLEGFLELESNLTLNRRGYKTIYNYPRGEVFSVEGINFLHGFYHNQFHAKKHLDSFEGSAVYFHTHAFQSFTKSRFNKNLRIGQAVGCMCDYEQDYMGKRPSAWQLGFLEIETGDKSTQFTSVMI